MKHIGSLEPVSTYVASLENELLTSERNLQSSNKQLRIHQEELLSVNEVLDTANAELQAKVIELSRANDDMNNFFAGSGIGTVYVDKHLCILRFTPTITRIIDLIPSDIGRPIHHNVPNLVGYTTLTADIQAVLDTRIPREVDVQTREKKWYTLRILPYRTLDNRIDGAVITFVDISEMVKVKEKLAHISTLLERTSELTMIGGWEHDLSIGTLFWSSEIYRILEVDLWVVPTVAMAQKFYASEMLATAMSGTNWEYEMPLTTAKGRSIWVRVLGFAEMMDNRIVKLIGSLQDITDRKEAEKALEQSRLEMKQIIPIPETTVTSPLAAILETQKSLMTIISSSYALAELTSERRVERVANIRAKEAQQANEVTLHGFFDGVAMMMGIVELVDEDILHISDNTATKRFFGMPEDIHYPYRASAAGVTPEQIRLWRTQYTACAVYRTPVTFEYEYISFSAGVRVLAGTVSIIDGPPDLPQRFAYLVTDITESKNAMADLLVLNKTYAFLASHDSLTGMFNRLAITNQEEAQLEQTGKSNYPLSMAMIDVDNFKAVNDNYGHPVGDLALIHIAKILLGTIRSSDSAGRWGGDEFLVVMPNTSLNRSESVV